MKTLKNICSTLMMLAISLSAIAAETSIYTEKQNKILLNTDQPEFRIKLKSNPTTGYSWVLKDYNASYLEPLNHSFHAPDNPKLIGAPGYELWTFKAKKAAFNAPLKTAIHFVYQRPWEKNKPGGEQLFWVLTTAPKKL